MANKQAVADQTRTTVGAGLTAPLPRLQCEVREGRFVDPCGALADLIDNIAPGFSKRKGIARWHLVNHETHKPSRSYIGVQCAAHPNGFLFNFCPVCGERIDAPFAQDASDDEGGDA